MKIKELINRREVVVKPFASINSVEAALLENEYLVIKREDQFVGLLTLADVVKKGHNLVIDCFTERPFVNEETEVTDTIDTMLAKKQNVLPVRSAAGKYIGSVQLDRLLQDLCDISKTNVNVMWTNVIGGAQFEEAKQGFSAELFHHIKNPIQVICSAVDILRTSKGNQEKELLLNSIASSAKQIDLLLGQMFHFYFREQGSAE